MASPRRLAFTRDPQVFSTIVLRKMRLSPCNPGLGHLFFFARWPNENQTSEQRTDGIRLMKLSLCGDCLRSSSGPRPVLPTGRLAPDRRPGSGWSGGIEAENSGWALGGLLVAPGPSSLPSQCHPQSCHGRGSLDRLAVSVFVGERNKDRKDPLPLA